LKKTFKRNFIRYNLSLFQYKKREQRKEFYKKISNGEIEVWRDFIDTNFDLPIMRKKFNNKFYEMYNTGFAEYEHGDWGKARKYLEIADVKIKP
jgi:hypothetical protein